MKTSALFSDDKRHRYELRWQWDASKPPFVIIMLNPSYANSHKLDPTCKNVMAHASRNGCGEMIVLNVGAGINTLPEAWKAMDDPIGPLNYGVIRRVLQECKQRNGLLVAGWGTHAESWMVNRVLTIIKRADVEPLCFGTTKHGYPKHPLYVRRNKRLERWNVLSSIET